MKHVKKLDLRMNRLTLPLTETMKFTVLEHITHFDIRDNQVSELDLRSLKTLEYLNCERNGMTNLQLNGTSLKLLFASCNCKFKKKLIYYIYIYISIAFQRGNAASVLVPLRLVKYRSSR